MSDDECIITDVFIKKSMKHKRISHDNILQLSSSDNSDNDDDDKPVLPLPLWDRIRQRPAV